MRSSSSQDPLRYADTARHSTGFLMASCLARSCSMVASQLRCGTDRRLQRQFVHTWAARLSQMWSHFSLDSAQLLVSALGMLGCSQLAGSLGFQWPLLQCSRRWRSPTRTGQPTMAAYWLIVSFRFLQAATGSEAWTAGVRVAHGTYTSHPASQRLPTCRRQP